MKNYSKKNLIYVLFLAIATTLSGQSSGPYYFSPQRELVFAGGGAGVAVLGYLMHKNVPDIPRRDLMIGNIPRYDRFAVDLFSEQAAQTSDYVLFTALSLPSFFVFSKDARSDWAKLGLLYGETLMINLGITDIIKSTVRRPRPYVVNESFLPDDIVDSNDRAAFLSGHTSVVAASSFFMARVFADYYPNSRFRPYAWGLAASFPALTGYLRIRAGRHYLSDVVAGYALGAAVGYFVPALHKRRLRVDGLHVSLGSGSAYLLYQF